MKCCGKRFEVVFGKDCWTWCVEQLGKRGEVIFGFVESLGKSREYFWSEEWLG